MAKKAKDEGRAETASGGSEGQDGDAAAAPPPGTVIPPKVAPKMRAGAALAPGQGAGTADPVAETASKTLDYLRENWQLLAAGVLVVVVATLFVTWRMDSSRSRNRAAWEQLRDAGERPDAAKLQELADRWGGTSAEPFILLKLGDANYLRGDRDGAQKALETYERVLRDYGSNEVAASQARSSIEVAKKMLAFDPAKRAAEKGEKVEWAKGAEPAAVTPTGATGGK
ncbi:MAG TPA: hypothetical protein VHF22_07845 [Planctomycetota bacterium]|nr:hypothetical protein [Planctomycetota bacterium]